MSDIAIRVEHVSKQYRIGTPESYKTLRDTLTTAIRIPFQMFGNIMNGHRSTLDNDYNSTIWALKDISFEVKRGEVIGIIGRNGAGKSTLLKILSQITEPTEGRVEIHGRVGSLLEVGTGFHQELTGRENIYLYAAILGMKKIEISRKFDEMVAFAEIEKFIDTPVKHYSSGMYMRLAFAVAAHLEPEILLVDEVLSVGDTEFRRKCLGKMENLSEGGRTVLFVSHDMRSIQQLCPRAVLLHEGEVIADESSPKVMRRYLSAGIKIEGERMWDEGRAPGDDAARLRGVRIKTTEGKVTAVVRGDEPFYIEIEYDILQENAVLSASFGLFDNQRTRLLGSRELNDNRRSKGRYLSRCLIPANLISPGEVHVDAALKTFAPVHTHAIEVSAIKFEIQKEDDSKFYQEYDLRHLNLEWEVSRKT